MNQEQKQEKMQSIVDWMLKNGIGTLYYDNAEGVVYQIDKFSRIKKAAAKKDEKDDTGYKVTGPWQIVGAWVRGQARLTPEKEKKQRVQDKQHLSLYVTPDEAQIIAQAAAISGKTMSGWCREILVSAARQAVSAD